LFINAGLFYVSINGSTHNTLEIESTILLINKSQVNSFMLEGVVHASQLIVCLQQFYLLQASSNSENKKTNNYPIELPFANIKTEQTQCY